jgi:hypothetical protein
MVVLFCGLYSHYKKHWGLGMKFKGLGLGLERSETSGRSAKIQSREGKKCGSAKIFKCKNHGSAKVHAQECKNPVKIS